MSAPRAFRPVLGLLGLALVRCTAAYSLGENEPCPTPSIACARRNAPERSACVDPRTDRFHCGGCGERCAEGAACLEGACCAAPLCGGCYGARFEDRARGGGSETIHAVFHDLDADGLDDVVYTQLNGATVTVVWGRRDGSLQDVTVLDSGRPGYNAPHPTDVDGDGHADVSITHQVDSASGIAVGDGVRVYFGDGHRGFARAHLFPVPQAEHLGNAWWFDVDGDGDRDLLTRSAGLQCTALRSNEATPGALPVLGEPRCVLGGLTDNANANVALHWLGRDQSGRAMFLEYERPDDQTTPVVRVTLERSGAHVASREVLPNLLSPGETLHSVTADFDRDGRADVLIAGEGPPGIPGRTPFTVAPQHADGSFTRCGGFEFVSAVDVHGQAGASAFGDFDGDGLLDAAGSSTCAYCPSMLHVFLRR